MVEKYRNGLSWVSICLSGALCVSLLMYAHSMSDAQRAARARASAYYSVLYGSQHPVVVLDTTGKISEWNKAAEDWFGWTAQEAVGKDPAFLIPKECYSQHCAAIQKRNDYDMGHSTKTITGLVNTKIGEKLPVVVTVSSARNGHGYYSIAMFCHQEKHK
jgi:PAS domain S-box-containing protein